MIVVIPFCARDKPQAVRLAEWIRDLGNVSAFDCLLAVYKDTTSDGVIEPLSEAFGRVAEFSITDDMLQDRSMYGFCANIMWKRTALHIADMGEPAPWIWLEPDAVPLADDWALKLKAEYESSGKPFLFDRIDMPNGTHHNSGCGVYPVKVRDYTSNLWQLVNEPWDVFLAPDFLPHTRHTGLIQDKFWQVGGDNPQMATFPDQASLAYLEPGAVLFHRCKDGTLIDRLRERKRRAQESAAAALPPPEMFDERGGAMIREAKERFKPVARRIYTYHAPVAGIDASDTAMLIALWKKEWSAKGWEPVVLGEDDAKKHPRYGEAQAVWASFPCQNPREYERACFNRWLALAAVGGGWMADTDVFPVHPEELAEGGLIFYSGNATDPRIPCLVYAFANHAAGVVDFLLKQRPTGKHFSDMFALRTLDVPNTVNLLVKEYGEPDWQSAPAIHFPTARMAPAGKVPKWQYIPELLREASALRHAVGVLASGTPRHLAADPLPATEIAELVAKIKELERKLAAKSKPKIKANQKPKRTAAEQAKINARMAKARAGRKLIAA